MHLLKTEHFAAVALFFAVACGISHAQAAQAGLPGGYSDSSPLAQDVKAAAEFAVSKQKGATLERVLAAETQVVAGLNYRLKIEVKTSSGPRIAQAVVYRDLENKLSLTSWQWLAKP